MAQIGQQLSFVNGEYLFDCLQFNDYEVINKEVDPVRRVEPYTLIDHRELDLASESYTAQLKLLAQAVLIGFFQQSRAKLPVHFDCGSYDWSRLLAKEPNTRCRACWFGGG